MQYGYVRSADMPYIQVEKGVLFHLLYQRFGRAVRDAYAQLQRERKSVFMEHNALLDEPRVRVFLSAALRGVKTVPEAEQKIFYVFNAVLLRVFCFRAYIERVFYGARA